jgi:hypothetical protein
MKTFNALLILGIISILGFILTPTYLAIGHTGSLEYISDKPPEVIRGGEWSDDFWQGELQEYENVEIQMSHLMLKYTEQAHWIQTWTAHFASGEFFHTEAISDTVRLSWDETHQDYFTSGIYTSTVFYAGKPVDWAYSEWNYSGVPEGVVVEFRTGNTPIPDGTWTVWMMPVKGNFEFMCAYTYPSDITECFNNMGGINSSPYIQYRASFESDHPSETIALYDIDLLYGIHSLSGSALSILIAPVDLREWKSVMMTATIPANSTLTIDLLDSTGSVLIPGVTDGTNLEGIDPTIYPAVQFRASLATTDASISPDVDLWGLKWSIWNRLYLPVLLR